MIARNKVNFKRGPYIDLRFVRRPRSVANHLDTIASVAPSGAIDLLREQITRLASQGGTALGVSFIVSLAISLWTANSGVKAVFDALNIVYGEEESAAFSNSMPLRCW